MILVVLVLGACDNGSSQAAPRGHVSTHAFRLGRVVGPHDRERTAERMQARYRALGASDAVVVVKGDRLLASGSDLVTGLAKAVATRGVLEFRPVLAVVPPEVPNPIPTDSPALVLSSRSSAGSAVRYAVGPPAVTGGVHSASAQKFGGVEGWVVDLTFTRRAKHMFNELAADSYPKQPPQNSVAIVLDGVVQSAPAFRTPSFNGSVQIGSNFTEQEAHALAAVLKTGPYPVAVRNV